MLSPDPSVDPIVEILRLAYRRGLVLLKEKATKATQAVSPVVEADREEKEDRLDPPSPEEKL